VCASMAPAAAAFRGQRLAQMLLLGPTFAAPRG
jgi:hypothetical protein